MGQEILEGLGYALRTPRIRLVLALLLVVSFCVFNFSVYVPLLARQVLGLGAEGFGFLMAAVGVGAVTGALALGILVPRRPPLPVLFVAATLACAGLIGLSAVRQFAVAVPVLFVVGFFGIIATAGSNTTLQLSAPDPLRGRVMSIYTLIFGGSFPVASFLIGAISERWSVSMAFLIAGVVGLGALTAIVARWRLGPRRWAIG
jgi:predicted MFS family arabinose efflux permease